MSIDISVDELKRKLASGDDFAIIDIREEGPFADWHIPGAVNLPVLLAMRMNDWAPLQAAAPQLPKKKPLVMVCNQGISSRKAAMVLQPMGFDVTSLAEGMNGWSGVHSEAPIDLPGTSDAVVVQVRRNAKGCLSYFIGSPTGGQSFVVDPSADVEAYLEINARMGYELTAVLETHVHADHVSRARELAEDANATLYLPANERVNFPYESVSDGDTIKVGDFKIEVIDTPGHTGESVTYLVNGKLALTGDTLFTDSVGRPDLEQGDEGAVEGAKMLYVSLHERLLKLDDKVIIAPAHTGAGIPFDGKAVCAPLSQVRTASELLDLDEEHFVPAIVDRIGAKPPSFTTIIEVNEGKRPVPSDPAELEVGPNRCAVG